MESFTTTAIVSVLLSKAFEKSGEKLGEDVSTKIGQLLNIIREKFKAEGIEGKLAKAQENPSEKHRRKLEKELAEQMEDDETFSKKLKALMDEIQLDAQVKQTFFRDINVRGDAGIGDIEQINKQDGSAIQEAITQVDVSGSFKVGNVKQRN
jgi:hypothetical protein